jgi:outer membrane protein OmpA-like peptidoglycan-associated protein
VAVDTARVEQRWEPYLSLRPEMVLARARKSLAPPSSVTLALVGDTLRLGGPAPLPWVAATAGLASFPPGVAALDLSRMVPETPAALARLEREIEGQRILFDVGSAALGREARSTAARVAASFGRIEAEAAAMGVRATLELIGRTDPTGSDSANQALSRNRAEAALGVLAARGVPAEVARVSAAGTTRPLPADDPAERARVNRSVSFLVSLGWRASRQESSR